LNAVAAPIGDTGEAITAVRHLAVRSGAETRFFKTSRALAHLVGGRCSDASDSPARSLTGPSAHSTASAS
jgi:hypothetical protein